MNNITFFVVFGIFLTIIKALKEDYCVSDASNAALNTEFIRQNSSWYVSEDFNYVLSYQYVSQQNITTWLFRTSDLTNPSSLYTFCLNQTINTAYDPSTCLIWITSGVEDTLIIESCNAKN